MSALLPLVLILAILVMLVLPGRRRVQAQRALLGSLESGDEVMTSGGIIGTVVALGEREASLEIAPGTVIRIALPAIIGRPAGAVPAESPAAGASAGVAPAGAAASGSVPADTPESDDHEDAD